MSLLSVFPTGYCSVHGEVAGTFDSHVFKQEVCGAINPSAAVGAVSGSFGFSIPHCIEHALNEPRYEIQYIRNHSVLGRMLAANASVVREESDSQEDNKEQYFDVLGLEHLTIFIVMVAFVTFIITYYVRSRQEKAQTYGGLSCFSAHDYDKEVMLNEETSSSYHL